MQSSNHFTQFKNEALRIVLEDGSHYNSNFSQLNFYILLTGTSLKYLLEKNIINRLPELPVEPEKYLPFGQEQRLKRVKAIKRYAWSSAWYAEKAVQAAVVLNTHPVLWTMIESETFLDAKALKSIKTILAKELRAHLGIDEPLPITATIIKKIAVERVPKPNHDWVLG